MNREAMLKQLNEEMIAEGRLLSNLANRGKFGRAFKAVARRYDRLEAAWRRLKKEQGQ